MLPCNDGKNIIKDYRLLFFVAALVLYGVFSSPTPNNPNFIEFSVAVLLIFALGISNLSYPFFKLSYKKNSVKWELAGSILFLYGLIVPSIFSVYYDADILILSRDIIAFVFLCLPIFIVPFCLKNEARSHAFLIGILFIGLAFSIRVLFLDFSFFSQREELLYLANSPPVLLSGVYFLIYAFDKTSRAWTSKNLMMVLIFTMVAMLPVAAMYIDCLLYTSPSPRDRG